MPRSFEAFRSNPQVLNLIVLLADGIELPVDELLEPANPELI